MAADPIIYCLEHVTDYDQFERLCNDLMACEGFENIEPLGGMKDKGRDAIHVSRSHPDDVTIFAYSVREDWRKKLAEDAEKIREYGHICKRLAFLNTAYFTPSERDEAVSSIEDEFGWKLELYGIERLRVLLVAKHERIIAKHPQIFPPPFFPMTGGIPLAFSPDYIIIDHKECDEALAVWLARRLTLEGYLVWCKSTAPTAGASLNQTIESLLKQRAFRFITILSPGAIADPDMAARRAQALAINTDRRCDMLIPIVAAPFSDQLLDAKTRQLATIRFDESWQFGLDKLLTALDATNCPKTEGGAGIALRSFMPPNVISAQPERLISNQFAVLRVPEVIHRFVSEKELEPEAALKSSLQWSFRRVKPTKFLSFHQPPKELREQLKIDPKGGVSWPSVEEIDGIVTRNLIPELLRKALIVACMKNVLLFCENHKLIYFPLGVVKSDRLYFTKPDGSRSFISSVGQRTYWRPGSRSEYRYHLSPNFSVQRMGDDTYSVLTRIRLRITDAEGTLLEGRTALSRRKRLCQDWWNDDWLYRILAVMQFLGRGGDIEIGELTKEIITISAQPHELIAPIGINEVQLSDIASSRKEAMIISSDADEDDGYADESVSV